MRAISAFVCLVLLTLTPTAYASPPDPTWIPGFYDNADYDDVIGLIEGTLGAVKPGVGWALRPMTARIGLVALAYPFAPMVASRSFEPSRAPPFV